MIYAKTYIVAERGGEYTSIQDALFQVEQDDPDFATIKVLSGVFDSASRIEIPELTGRLVISGCGNSMVNANFCVSNVRVQPVPTNFYISDSYFSLVLQNLNILGSVNGVKERGIGSVLLENCKISDSNPEQAVVCLDGRVGGWYLHMFNCEITQENTPPTIELEGLVQMNLDNCRILQHGNPDTSAIYLLEPVGVKLIKNCAIQNVSGGLGASIDAGSGGPYPIYAYGNAWNTYPSMSINVLEGSVDTNTLIPAPFLMGTYGRT